ncbi:MAG: class I SAM-dependent RNA methyltransferase [Kiritimatiellia bacterium]
MSTLTAHLIDIGDESMLGLCEDGRKIWLEGPGVPGDRVALELDGKKGLITEILEPAPARQPPFCPHFERCPGCQLQPLPSSRQLELKAKKIVETLRRLGGFSEVPFDGIYASPREQGSRNKLDFTVEGPRLGYQTRDGLLEIQACPAGDPLFQKFIPPLRKWLSGRPRHALHRILLRTDGDRKKVHLLLRGQLEADERASLLQELTPIDELCAVSLQRDWRAPWESLFGDGTLRFRLAGQEHLISYDGFFQVNPELADQLVRDTLEEIRAADGSLLDLFCGAGAFTLPAAAAGFEVLGLDSRPGKGPFQQADLRKGVPPKLRRRKWTTLITDPPRAGMEKVLCSQIRDEICPRQILYISCNPATLARDLQRICANGAYALQKVKGYDLFPHTTHVETLAILQRV